MITQLKLYYQMTDTQKEPLLVNPYGITDEGHHPNNVSKSDPNLGKKPNFQNMPPPPQVIHAEAINLPPGISPQHSKLFG